ncbi:MAG: electron transfer flavoprotein subunit alpha/FixB family protein [Pseudomonadota bacterium]
MHNTKYRLLALVPIDTQDGIDPMSAITAAAALAARFDTSVEALVLGADPGDASAAEAARCGAGKVWLCAHPALGNGAQSDQLVAAFAQALSRLDLAGQSAHDDTRHLVLLPAGALGEEVAARLACRFNGVALGHCADMFLHADGIRAVRASHGGRARLELTSANATWFATMRGPKTTAGATPLAAADIVRIELGESLPPPCPLSHVDMSDNKMRLEGARIIVSGGRGMAGGTGFSLLDELADCLGAAVGGSLPAVDAGWVPVSCQVGQSGRYVAPEIYVAVGISGTPQHMAGIDPGTRIVAINADPEADIFNFAEIGIVGDWPVVLPALIQRLRRT